MLGSLNIRNISGIWYRFLYVISQKYSKSFILTTNTDISKKNNLEGRKLQKKYLQIFLMLDFHYTKFSFWKSKCNYSYTFVTFSEHFLGRRPQSRFSRRLTPSCSLTHPLYPRTTHLSASLSTSTLMLSSMYRNLEEVIKW